MKSYEESGEPSARRAWAREVAMQVDPLLADVWAFAWSGDAAGEDTPLAILLRLAYLQGYRDALEEPLRGTLFQKLGVEIPPVKKPRRAAARPAKEPRRSSGS